jgi:diguanylate cyclase (GGDEF)-like protein/putative nucleotidyltransferase with HDIG domain
VRIRIPLKAALFLSSILILTATAWFTQQDLWALQDHAKYLCYFFAALLAAGLHVKSRSTGASTSMAFVFVLIALVELDIVETLLIAGSAILLQTICRRVDQERVVETLSTLLSTSCATLAAQLVYHWDWLRNANLEVPVRLVIAAVACFFAYTLPIVATTALSGKVTLERLKRSFFIWSAPYYLIAAVVTAFYSAMHPFVNWYTAAFLIPMVYLLYRSYRLYVGRIEDQRLHSAKVSALHMRTIETLALAIEAKDQTTADHLRRVRVYAVAVGEELGLDEVELEALRAAAVLHDIGKLAVPEHIISKPGKLTPEEFEKMKIHPVVGAEILERARFPYAVAPIVRAHHERWDGSGYPDGLRAEQIPLGARILAAVDCLDALASDRQYRRALPLDRAMDEVAVRSGRDFDPRVVEVLARRYVELEAKAQAEPLARINGLMTGVPVRTGGAPGTGLDISEYGELPPAPAAFVRTIGAAREEVQALFDLTQELGNSLNLNDTFQGLTFGLRALVPYDALAVLIRQQDQLEPLYVHGDLAGSLCALHLAVGEGVSGWVAANEKPAVNYNPADEDAHLSAFHSALSVPLAGMDGVFGALTLYSMNDACYTPDHLRVLKAIAPKLALVIENGMKFKKAEDTATTDYLTGLPNAHSLFLHLDSELALSRCLETSLTILVCDLNGFKDVNDTMGHLAGNQLLQSVARGLRENCRENDYIARMGGDEFVLVLPHLPKAGLNERVSQLRNAVREAGARVSRQVALDASFGAAVFPQDGASADELLAAADRQMYGDKIRTKTGGSFRRRERPVLDRRLDEVFHVET